MSAGLPKKRLITIDVSYGTYKDFVGAIISHAISKKSSYVCVANVHMMLEAYESEEFQRVVNEAYLVTPDGMPLAKSFKTLYKQHQVRVDGMSLLPTLLKESQEQNLSVYFYGGTDSMLERTVAYVNDQYPQLKIAGTYSPPFRPLDDNEMNEIATKISLSGANIIFVALGCPKQEKWMHAMKDKIPAIMVGIGGALPVMIGLQKRAPAWMQRNSLEWLFRLNQEPKRLFKRYFKTNSQFLFLMTKENLKNNILRTKWKT